MARIRFGLFGAGGFAREVMPYTKASICNTLGVSHADVEAYFVETWEPLEKSANGHPIISIQEFLKLDGDRYFNVAVGDGRARELMVRKVGTAAKVLPIYAPQTVFLEGNRIGIGAVFCPNSMVTSNAEIGQFFQANIFSYVAHDCAIGDFVTFAPGVRCNGRVHIGDYAYIGTNAVIREGTPTKPLRIGASAIVGMGAVVTKDVPDGITVVGNPARPLQR